MNYSTLASYGNNKCMNCLLKCDLCFLFYASQTINVTTAATGYGLALACDTLISQVSKPHCVCALLLQWFYQQEGFDFTMMESNPVTISMFVFCRLLAVKTWNVLEWFFKGVHWSCWCFACHVGLLSWTLTAYWSSCTKRKRWRGKIMVFKADIASLNI